MNMSKSFLGAKGVAGVLVLLMVTYVCAFFWVVPFLHDVTLKKFSTPLLSISVPENTKQIDSISAVGQQFANGNHCDYLAALLVESSQSKDNIQKYYKEHYAGNSEVHFVFLDEENSYTKDIFDSQKIYSLGDWINNHKISSTTIAVYIFEGHMTSSFDYRCS